MPYGLSVALLLTHNWIDKLNATSTAVIALFTILLFFGVIAQVQTSRQIERAWVMAELGWYEGGLHVSLHSSTVGSEERHSTRLNVKLTCKNDGKSPAWVEHIFGRADIVSSIHGQVSPHPPPSETLDQLGEMEPLGPGVKRSRVLQMSCDGKWRDGDFICVYAIIIYRDIFNKRRTTSVGYTIVSVDEIYRQVFRERNKNT